jgi:nucleoside phosphorylase
VAWIAALPHERAAGEAMFDEEYEEPPSDFKQSPGDPNAYSWGKTGRHYVVVVALPAGEYGLTSTATIAQGLRSSLPHIRIGLLVGIGAGVREIVDKQGKTVRQRDMRLGDVAVSNPDGVLGGVVQADFAKAMVIGDKKLLERKGFLNSPPIAVRTALSKLQGRYERKGSDIPAIQAQAFQRNPAMQTKYRHPSLNQPESERKADIYSARDGSKISNEARKIPEIHYGIIVSSNTLERSAHHRDAVLARLAKENVQPVCFEMEAAGLMNNFPCLVIRGVCDYGDESKNDDWQRYAALMAAGFAKEFLSCVDIEAVQRTQEIGKLVLQKSESVSFQIA